MARRALTPRVQHGEQTFFRVKKTTPLSKLFEAYSARKGVGRDKLRFMLDGAKISDDQTAAQVRCALRRAVAPACGRVVVVLSGRTRRTLM
jgi:hypothetical protein